MNTPPCVALNCQRIRATSLLAVLGATAMFSGCASEPESHIVSAPPPAGPVATQAVVAAPTTSTTTVTTATPVAPNTVVVTQAPPAIQTETIPPQPSSSHVWIAGYWSWSNNSYVWQPGHWELPPRPGAVWVPPRWERRDGSNDYVFYEGYWN